MFLVQPAASLHDLGVKPRRRAAAEARDADAREHADEREKRHKRFFHRRFRTHRMLPPRLACHGLASRSPVSISLDLFDVFRPPLSKNGSRTGASLANSAFPGAFAVFYPVGRARESGRSR